MEETFLISITVDTNDADYATETTHIEAEDISKLKNIISKMPRDSRYGNINRIEYRTEECGDDDLQDSSYDFITNEEKVFLNDYFPSTEYGFHHITDITISKLIETIL